MVEYEFIKNENESIEEVMFNGPVNIRDLDEVKQVFKIAESINTNIERQIFYKTIGADMVIKDYGEDVLFIRFDKNKTPHVYYHYEDDFGVHDQVEIDIDLINQKLQLLKEMGLWQE